jgi:protein-L-isoaspartate(D-aspartate) O-methyltransferase
MDFEAARARLIKHLSAEIKDARVLSAMSRIPREFFVPAAFRRLAYEDEPLPIGLEQTISQPYIIALMTQELELSGQEKVLEIGTGSGYQTALLAELSQEVVTVERLEELLEAARQKLQALQYNNIEMHPAEETLGWESEAPYDAVIVTAGAPNIPAILLKQLAIEGRMVIPVGSRYEQDLLKVTKLKERKIIRNLGSCRFVPLIAKGAWE